MGKMDDTGKALEKILIATLSSIPLYYRKRMKPILP